MNYFAFRNNLIHFYSFLVIILTIFHYCRADELFVDPVNGSEANSGLSIEEAFQTITYALSQVSASESNPAFIP